MQLSLAGIQWLSCIDFPGELSTVLFTAGCNLSCEYCHNLEVILGKGKWFECEYIIELLQQRRDLVDAVVISGGEPTLQRNLPEFLSELAHNGFKVKLDTNGTRPECLRRCLESGALSYVAMDIKAPPYLYSEVIGKTIDIGTLNHSINLIRSWGGDYEFRSTILPGFDVDDILKLAALVKGARRLVLQPFKSNRSIYESDLLNEFAATHDFMTKAKLAQEQLMGWFMETHIRIT